MSTAEKGGRLRAPRREPAKVLHVRRLLPPPDDARTALKRMPAQARLLARLPDRGEMPLAEVRRFHPQARSLLDKLAASGWVEWVERPPAPDPLLLPPTKAEAPPHLTDDQQQALRHILAAMETRQYRGILLQGVTGSGKTEVYLHAIAQALRQGRSALVLVPEIALTPQLVARFRGRLGSIVGLLHSGLTAAQRLREWSRLRAGEARVAIGARSAIFAPLTNLGVVVVDEEHDPSFKQEDGFRYNGRDLALLRARRAGAVAILGSATPALETMFNASQGKLDRVVLPRRVTPRPLPRVEAVDLRNHRSGPGNQFVVTGPMVAALKQTIETDHQAILFLNRRGYAPTVNCQGCGEPLVCRECSVSMTFHRRTELLECHYCAHAQALPGACPSCGGGPLQLLGAGTEKVEELLRDLLGDGARIGRLDSDVAPGRASEAVLDRVRSGETNVLVGTQLVTKGHDLPGVTLVGVLLADASMHFPDFRATERTFQLLSQVAGRAGRGQEEGQVFIQTFSPSHPAIQYAMVHDYDSFFQHELKAREELGYPPFGHLAAIRLSSVREEPLRLEAEALVAFARRLPDVQHELVEVKGPAPAPIARVRNRFRYRILLQAPARPPLRRVVLALLTRAETKKSAVRVAFDMDPVSML
jgi:primosomal protein N' (replication factor Y)